jgi:hypothetical protein
MRSTVRSENNVAAEGAANAHNRFAPQPMRLVKRVLVEKKWNDGPDAFGLDKPPAGKDGAVIGPAAVAFARGNIYLLDNVNRRLLGFDQSGQPISSVAIPSNVATDLTVDASGNSLVLIDHMNDSLYKMDGNEAVLLGRVPLKQDFPLGTKFDYDAVSNTLHAQDLEQDGLVRIDGSNLILGGKGLENVTIPFDKPVACVEEMITDPNGIVWVLYTLEGDFRMRRIARVDRAQGSVGVAEVDAWFAFDSTRHMATTPQGVVLFAGDEKAGRLVAFDYAGGNN